MTAVKARITKDRTDDTGLPWYYTVDALVGTDQLPIDYGSHATQEQCMASVEYALTHREKFDYTESEIAAHTWRREGGAVALKLDTRKTVDLGDVLREASDLVDEPGTNAEYERALVELVTRLFATEIDAHRSVRALLGWPSPSTTATPTATEGKQP